MCYDYTMTNPQAQHILGLLSAKYPDAACELTYNSDFQLLVAVILSAQCTDKRVNRVTKELFAHADTPEGILSLGQDALEKLIYTCGFYRQKAKSILSCAADILAHHAGRVPNTFNQLVKLRGVGRKTANVVLSVAFNKPRIAVDTHVFRVSRRLGLSNGTTPKSVEADLEKVFLPESLTQAHHVLIFHGRYCCKARNPDCTNCPVTAHCTAFQA